MAGVPARQIGWVCECGAVLNETHKCSSCGREYIEQDNELVEKVI